MLGMTGPLAMGGFTVLKGEDTVVGTTTYFPMRHTAEDPTNLRWRSRNGGSTFVPFDGIYTGEPVSSAYEMLANPETVQFNDPDAAFWDLSQVTNATGMFANQTEFNQPIDNWDISNVKHFSAFFLGATSFNQPINQWDVSRSKSFEGMFYGASSFNQDLDLWDVRGGSTFHWMFFRAAAFNGKIDAWNTQDILDMDGMFEGASSFNQDLSGWCVPGITTKPPDFDRDASSWTLPQPVWGTCP